MFKAIADATEAETINTIWLLPSKEESLKIKTLIDKKIIKKSMGNIDSKKVGVLNLFSFMNQINNIY